ncbi:hypothetical protein [Blastopirellula marina]|uniref:Uncharacterized protein n=1 Tax=Blastopirellula marina DSM 3645 TaxID=314230 RepID=A3ZNU7_9BACT|nr:hypothetical protein [Blastopirellula marina]EAQ81995.1 hypothetical protein DSM3645_17625 [Blastopirellula marina DSM 3645]
MNQLPRYSRDHDFPLNEVLLGIVTKIWAFTVVSCLLLVVVGCENDNPNSQIAKPKRLRRSASIPVPSSSLDEIDQLTGEPMHYAVFDTYIQAFRIMQGALSPSFNDLTTDFSEERIGRELGGRIILHRGVVEAVSASGDVKRFNYDIRFVRSLSEGKVTARCYFAEVAGDILLDDRLDVDVVSLLGNGEPVENSALELLVRPQY